MKEEKRRKGEGRGGEERRQEGRGGEGMAKGKEMGNG